MTVLDITDLDLAWERINALGGTAGVYDDFGRGINHAVEQALCIIEDLGGSDPLPKRSKHTAEIMDLYDRTMAMLKDKPA